MRPFLSIGTPAHQPTATSRPLASNPSGRGALSRGVGAHGRRSPNTVGMTTPTLTLTTSLRGADLLVVGLAKGPDGPAVASTAALTAEQQAALTAAAAAIGATGRADEVLRLPGEPFGLPPVMVTGLGDMPSAPTRRRPCAGQRARPCAQPRRTRSRWPCPPGRRRAWSRRSASAPSSGPTATRAAAVGQLGSPQCPRDVQSLVGAADGPQGRRRPAPQAISGAIAPDPRLVDTPPGRAAPGSAGSRGGAAVEGSGVEVEVLDEKALRKQEFGGILAVGQGSANPPRLVRLSYAPAGPRAPGAGRQGHHLRLRRPLPEAGRRDGHHEVRHGRRRRRPGRRPGHRRSSASRCA